MDASEGKDNLIRDKATRLFEFLRELAKLKTKTIRDLSAYDSVVWFHQVPKYKGCFSIFSSESDEAQDNIWLEIRKQPEPKRPTIPPSCSKWLDPDSYTDPLVEPRLREEVPANNVSTQDSSLNSQLQETLFPEQFELLTNYPEILQEWQHYIQDSWRPWSETYRWWKAVNDLYFELFSIYQQLKKLGERYELQLGLGVMTWETPDNQIIRRHIIMGDAYLTFDADRAKFELQGASEGIKLHFETEMIAQSYLPSLDQQKELEALLSTIQELPWNKDELDKVLRSWIQSISPDGEYSDSLIPPKECTSRPTVTFAPAVILRQRTQRTQVQHFTHIIEQISAHGSVPLGVQQLCEVSENIPGMETGEERTDSGKLKDYTLYLPLHTNEEQRQIVHQIENRRGILVQGPPGTGKSHTIANIICHLLAQGKRVLVTSQTPRALKVLKEKIPQGIAALCVTLLGNDEASRKELENSVTGISQRYSEWNRFRNQEEIASLETHLFETKKAIADNKRLSREEREIETYDHEVAAGIYKGTAQQIARRVRDEESKFNWLIDDAGDSESRPISSAEFMELVQLYRELSDDYCSELKQELVSRDCIPDIPHFVRMIDDEKAAKQKLEAHSQRRQSLRFRILEQLPEDNVKSLHNSVSNLVAAIGSIKDRFEWVHQARSDMLSDNNMPWKELRDFMVGHLRGLSEKATIIQSFEVQIPHALNRRKLQSDAQDLLNHLEKGGMRGWKFFAPQVVKRTRYITEEVRINGQECSTIISLKSLVTYLSLLGEIENIWSSWQGGFHPYLLPSNRPTENDSKFLRIEQVVTLLNTVPLQLAR